MFMVPGEALVLLFVLGHKMREMMMRKMRVTTRVLAPSVSPFVVLRTLLSSAWERLCFFLRFFLCIYACFH